MYELQEEVQVRADAKSPENNSSQRRAAAMEDGLALKVQYGLLGWDQCYLSDYSARSFF